MKRSIVFDLDGTLVDTLPDIQNALAMTLAEYGKNRIESFSVRDFIGGGSEAMVAAAARVFGITDTHRLHERYASLYKRKCVDQSRPYSGIVELLEWLTERGISVAVLTNKDEQIAHEITSSLFPAGSFDLVYGAAQGRAKKPSPQGLHQVLEQLGSAPDRTCYVGDTLIDVMTGQAAKVETIAVAWGYGQVQEFMDIPSVRFCNTVFDLRDHLR